MSKSAKNYEWGDENIKPRNFDDRPERYKAKKGRVDRIVILTPPVSCFGASVKFKHEDTGFFAYSLADHDDMVAASEGDADALERCKKACPLWREGHQVKRRFCTLVYHVSMKGRDNKERRVGTPYPWVIDEGKYAQLSTIANSLPIVKGKRPKLRSVELLITCEDTNFQKISISLAPDKKAKLTDIAAEVAEYFDGEKPLTGSCSLIDDCIAPDTPMDLQRSLDRAAGLTRGDDDDIDDGEDDAPKRPARRRGGKASGKGGGKARPGKTTRRARDEDDDEIGDHLDDALGDDDDDDDGIDAEDYDEGEDGEDDDELE